jgi:hypothetical protein
MTDEGSRVILCGHCPNCDADRNAEIRAEDTLEKVHEESGIWFRSTYSILRCLGCDRGYIRLAELCSEDWDDDFDPATGETSSTLNERVTYWPSIPPNPASPATRPRPDWLWGDHDPLELDLSLGFASEYPELARLLLEVYGALDNKLHILANIGMRTVFDCASQKLVPTLTKTSRKSSKSSPQGTR